MKRRNFIKNAAIFSLCTLNSSIAFSQKHTKTQLGIDKVIDVHAHFFNVTDMQAAGYLKGPVAQEMSSGIVKYFLQRIAPPFVDHLSNNKKFLNAGQELQRLTEQFSHKSSASADGVSSFAQAQDDKTLEILKQEVKASNEPTINFFRFLKNPSEDNIYLKNNDEIDDKFVEDVFLGDFVGPNVDDDKFFKSKEHKQLTLGGAAYLVSRMLCTRLSNINKFFEHYSDRPKTFGVNACVGAMVDFNHYLSGKNAYSASSIQAQITLHAYIASHIFPQQYFPVVSYNPWSDIKLPDSAYKAVERALDQGFIGIKLYPAIGYKAYGNYKGNNTNSKAPICDNSKGSIQRPSDQKQVDKNLMRLYTLAAKKGAFIMSHTGFGKGQTDCTSKYGTPEYWKEMIEQSPKGLKIQLGHFGHMPTADAKHYQGFIDLIQANANKAIYADIGFWSDLYKSKSLTNEFCKALLEPTGFQQERIYQRVMYGSDWFMLVGVGSKNWKKYPYRLFKALEEGFLAHSIAQQEVTEILNAIAYKNAERFYCLNQQCTHVTG